MISRAKERRHTAVDRCGTAPVSAARRAQVDRDLANDNTVALSSDAYDIEDIPKKRKRVTNLNVYISVVTPNTTAAFTRPISAVENITVAAQPLGGFSTISDDQIHQQIAVLNKAYNGHGFNFTVRDIKRVINTYWYSCSNGDMQEADMKRTLRVGGPKDLNVYLNNPPGGVLGWSTFPFDYPSSPIKDGVVINQGTLPEGHLVPFNLGYTLVHEVRGWWSTGLVNLTEIHVAGVAQSETASDFQCCCAAPPVQQQASCNAEEP